MNGLRFLPTADAPAGAASQREITEPEALTISITSGHESTNDEFVIAFHESRHAPRHDLAEFQQTPSLGSILAMQIPTRRMGAGAHRKDWLGQSS